MHDQRKVLREKGSKGKKKKKGVGNPLKKWSKNQWGGTSKVREGKRCPPDLEPQLGGTGNVEETHSKGERGRWRIEVTGENRQREQESSVWGGMVVGCSGHIEDRNREKGNKKVQTVPQESSQIDEL